MKSFVAIIGAIGAVLAVLFSSKNATAQTTPNDPYVSGTRGERNKNPGNIRFNPNWVWIGQVGKDSSGYLIFDTVENGIRAIAKDLLTKYNRGLDTVTKIISVYAPPSENDTLAYIRAVCSAMSVGPHEMLDLESLDIMSQLVGAIIHHENGRVVYSSSVITSGIERALI